MYNPWAERVFRQVPGYAREGEALGGEAQRSKTRRKRNRSVTNIYVGNLSYDATEESLRQAFAEYGEVSSVKIITDRETGRSRGFAFVEMPDADAAKEAIENLNETEIAGRSVTVNEARPRSDRPRRGGGRRDRW
jgi:RNA recognition motif-containing protein